MEEEVEDTLSRYRALDLTADGMGVFAFNQVTSFPTCAPGTETSLTPQAKRVRLSHKANILAGSTFEVKAKCQILHLNL